ncbi:hypothetical protein OC00_12215 [Xanthomonas vasicola]|nr:hypothetical protein NX08_018415 [Xanthomonas vasicola]KGR52093.1 hypothetical protein NX07_12085 [Xanthomonas vasicola]KGR56213.1 hypothetical protein NX09_09355 [Xanthomonas vasicola]KGT83709.1 hypothetical protein OC00_12215 [Xanthomonas vasicola]
MPGIDRGDGVIRVNLSGLRVPQRQHPLAQRDHHRKHRHARTTQWSGRASLRMRATDHCWWK